MSQALKIWKSLENKPAGKYLFSKLLCLKAPYFGSISPLFEDLKPEYCAETSCRAESFRHCTRDCHVQYG